MTGDGAGPSRGVVVQATGAGAQLPFGRPDHRVQVVWQAVDAGADTTPSRPDTPIPAL